MVVNENGFSQNDEVLVVFARTNSTEPTLKRIQESDFIHPEPISAEKRAILKGFFLKDK